MTWFMASSECKIHFLCWKAKLVRYLVLVYKKCLWDSVSGFWAWRGEDASCPEELPPSYPASHAFHRAASPRSFVKRVRFFRLGQHLEWPRSIHISHLANKALVVHHTVSLSISPFSFQRELCTYYIINNRRVEGSFRARLFYHWRV